MATQSRFTYTIDPETFAVTIFDNSLEDAHIPAIYQPHHPDANGEPWEDADTATAWAEEFIAFQENPVNADIADDPNHYSLVSQETPAETPTTPSK